MRILYISRKHPPSVGGMEKVSYEIYSRLSKMAKVSPVTWGGSTKWLFVVIPFFVLKSIYILLTKKIDIIYIADGSISPLMFFLMIFKKPTIITIHALDITYNNWFYQLIIPRYVRKANKVICVSSYTRDECRKRGVSNDNIIVIKNGISDDYFIKNKNIDELRNEIEKIIDVSLKNKKIMLSTGRLIERKGFHWFIKEVIPEISKTRKDFIYIIAGSGKFENKIKTTIVDNNLERLVYPTGQVSSDTLKKLYNCADVFIMPNIKVEGDAEGFGLVALEAASCGLPVVASDLEGIKDALEDYKLGYLIAPSDKIKYANIIGYLLEKDEILNSDIEKSRNVILENYNWNTIATKYFKEFDKIIIS